MKTMFAILVLLTASLAAAQGTVTHVRYGSTLPSTCSASDGEIFFLTSGTVGLYACTATNTWTSAAGGGGGSGSGALTLITETVLTGTSTNITFSGISNSYRDLIVRCQLRGDAASNLVYANLTFNSDTSANYDLTYRLDGSTNGENASFGNTSASVNTIPGSSAETNYAGDIEYTIDNYKGTTFYKTGYWRSWADDGHLVGGFIQWGGFAWRSTSAITSVTVTASSGNWISGSICSLYGRS